MSVPALILTPSQKAALDAGFAGVFGYRTEVSDRPGDRQAEIEKATAVADRLKELGYTFASHSYGHFNHEKHSEASLRRDL